MQRFIVSMLVSAFLLAPGSVLAHMQNNASAKLATVAIPNRSPLISFRLVFNTGAASDPRGKEGLAALTAAMLAQGGSRAMTYEQIVEAMYPMATGFGWQIDKEMTTFSGTAHIDNLEKYYGLISQMLLDQAFVPRISAGLKLTQSTFSR